MRRRKVGESLRVDRIYPGVGRIARSSGTMDPKRRREIVSALDSIALQGRQDLLRAVRDGALTIPDLHEAYTSGGLDGMTASGRPAEMRPACFVYVVRRPDTGALKIGIAANVTARLRALQVANDVSLELVGYFPGSVDEEESAHTRLAAHRKTGEWFHPSPEVLEWVSESVPHTVARGCACTSSRTTDVGRKSRAVEGNSAGDGARTEGSDPSTGGTLHGFSPDTFAGVRP